MTDVLGAEQHCFPETAGAPYGDAYLVGIGIGLFRDFQSFRLSWARGGYVIEVDQQAHQAYSRAYSLYLDAIRFLQLERAF
jgi:sugar (pentulose or hexulose) kinase